MNGKERTYSIGHGWIITDNGLSLRASNGRHSIGIERPFEIPEEGIEAIFSRDGKLFYLNNSSLAVAAWLGYEKLDEKAIGNKPNHSFEREGEAYYRFFYPFAFYEIKSGDPPYRVLEKGDQALSDYYNLYVTVMKAREADFNKAIEETGRNLKWILDKIGPWVEPETIPTIALED